MLFDGGHVRVVDQQLAVNGERGRTHRAGGQAIRVEQRIEFIHARRIGVDEVFPERDARGGHPFALLGTVTAGGERIHHHAVAGRERIDIFRLHMKKRLKHPEVVGALKVTDEALGKLADVTEGFIGAEIEQVVISALFEAFAESRAILFRMERDPAHVAPGSPYALSDLELASRLSFRLSSAT